MTLLAPALEITWEIAALEAAHARSEFIEPAHLLIGLCKLEDFVTPERIQQLGMAPEARNLFHDETSILLSLLAQAQINPVTLRRELRQVARPRIPAAPPDKRGVMHRSPQSRRLFAYAEAATEAMDGTTVLSLHLLVALLDTPDTELLPWLTRRGVAVATLYQNTLEAAAYVTTLINDAIQSAHAEAPPATTAPFSHLNEWTAIATTPPQESQQSVLAACGVDLTAQARAGRLPPVVGRTAEMLQVVRTLSRATKNAPLLIGEAGVGKTAIVEGLALRLAEGNVPDAIRDQRIIHITLTDLLAGTRYRGQFEERLQGLLREVSAASDIILFIDEIHTLVGAGKGDGALDAANILKPALARGLFRCIGATTTDEYRRYIEPDAALERRFQPIVVNEPSPAEALEMLLQSKSRLEARHNLVIDEAVVRAAVDLATKYLPDRRLPDKAFDLLDEACARSQITALSMSPLHSGAAPAAGPVTVHMVAEVLAEWTGIPAGQVTEDERSRLLRMPAILKERVIGQDEAVDAVALAVQRARTGLKPAGRPIAVLLFVGPTGVGKTELARATAEFLFGDEQAMIRLDMSEYSEKHTVSRLLGAPPGYVGYEDEGQISGALRRCPFSVVLFDEVEKAHPDIHNLFLQLFEDGRLTDAQGRLVDASNALFIMTSNIGFNRPVGLHRNVAAHGGGAVDRQALLSQLKAAFRPELLNRIDDVIVFEPLTAANLAQVARLMLNDLHERLAAQGLRLQATAAAIEFLAAAANFAEYGARPLRGAISQYIENPLGGLLLREEARPGHTIIVDVQDQQLRLAVVGQETM